MLRKYFLLPAVFAIALMLGATDSAMAQRARGRGYAVPAYRGYNTWNRGYYNRPYYNNWRYYNRPYYYNNYYRPSYYYNGGYYPSYGGYAYPSYSYSTPYYGNTYSSYDVAPSANVVVSNRAEIEVTVPDPNAQVWVNNLLMTQTGTDRLYQTPPISSTGSYHIRAQWQQDGRTITREKDVTVAPGESAVVHFTAIDY